MQIASDNDESEDDILSLDSSKALKQMEPKSALYFKKRKLSKLDLSTPMLRAKRFSMEMMNDSEIYESDSDEEADQRKEEDLKSSSDSFDNEVDESPDYDERISEDEVMSAIDSAGISSMNSE